MRCAVTLTRRWSHPPLAIPSSPACWRSPRTCFPSDALGALSGKLLDLLPPAMRDSLALHAAIESLIETDGGKRVLTTWATVAPTGWDGTHTVALIDAVYNGRCDRRAVAALIGH